MVYMVNGCKIQTVHTVYMYDDMMTDDININILTV